MSNKPKPSPAREPKAVNNTFDETVPVSSDTPWLSVVEEKVKAIRHGVVQIAIRDSKVVQIECMDRTRFEIPPA